MSASKANRKAEHRQQATRIICLAMAVVMVGLMIVSAVMSQVY